MDCSDDSFAWTDASSDSSIMTPEIHPDDHDESGLDYKRKLQEELFNNESISGKSKKRKRKASDMLDSSPVVNKKVIKTEPESDIEAPKKKKKRKNTETEERLAESQDTLLAEDYLNLRVKQEQTLFTEPGLVKKKKKKHKKEKDSEFEIHDSESTETPPIENESEINIVKDNSLNSYDKTIAKIDKFEAEETIVQKKKKKRKQENKCNSSELEETQNSSSENISENCKKTDTPKLTNGTVDTDSDFEPQQTHIKHASKTSNSKKKSKKSDKESPIKDSETTSPAKKSTKITDRLTFEDEESVDSEKMSNIASKQLQQFVNMNTKLKVCSSKNQKENIITDDDDVWIFRIPKEVNINDLKDLNFILDTKWKIKINGQSYDGVIENHISQVPLLCYDRNKCHIKNVPLMGEVSLRKRIPKAHIPQETSMINNQTNFIPLPETKCRHPLFGINYKKAIKIPKTIAERLNGNFEEDTLLESFSGKKEKKKKHKTEKKVMEKELLEVDVEELQASNPKKKKRKRKHSEAIQDIDTNKSKKSKSSNPEPDSTEDWASEQAIEANLFNF